MPLDRELLYGPRTDGKPEVWEQSKKHDDEIDWAEGCYDGVDWSWPILLGLVCGLGLIVSIFFL